MDATDEGGCVQISTRLEEGWIHVAICDDGCGISHEDRETIFQPYFTTKPTGTGLGLFVCQHIISQMEFGRIELTESAPGRTVFTVSISCESVRQCRSRENAPVFSTEEVKAT